MWFITAKKPVLVKNTGQLGLEWGQIDVRF